MNQNSFACTQMVSSIAIYCLHTVKWLQVYSKWVNRLIDETLTATSRPGSNGNEGVLYIRI